MKTLPADLVVYVETEILPRYNGFDPAHRQEHVRGVIRRSLALARQYGADERLAYTAAAYHDVGLCAGRETHHLVSGEILAADKRLPDWFTPDEIEIMRRAVQDHRASAGCPPHDIYGKIVAQADRQLQADVTLRRTVQYGLTHTPHLNRQEQFERFAAHLRAKYAVGGYLKLWLSDLETEAELAQLRAVIADETLLRRRFDALFDEEIRPAQR